MIRVSKKSRKRYENSIKERYDGNYSIGLDIGTNSVGWAVIDDSYQIPVYKGKKAWGVRRFDQGNTAENRRLKRGSRRRINRRRKRLEYLKEIFQIGLNEIDEKFLIAHDLIDQEDSAQAIEKFKRDSTMHSLQKVLKVISKSQKEYQELIATYPTMFHLRYDIISNPNRKFDLRLIYLALHHITKKRGHFIQEGLEVKELLNVDVQQIRNIIEEISTHYSDEPISLTNEEAEQLSTILRDTHITRNDRVKKAKKIQKSLDHFARALLGMKFSVTKLFNIDDEDKKIEFNKELEPQLEELSDILDDIQTHYLFDLQSVYTSLVFEDVMQGSHYFSEAKVKEFNTYKEQLLQLKELLKPHEMLYKQVFITPKPTMKEWKKTREKTLYKQFSLLDRYNYSDINSKNDILDHEAFCRSLESVLKKVTDSNEKEEILDKLNKGKLLLKLNRRDNGAIPYQLHLAEAKKILENQKKFHDVIDDEVINRVCKLISFRIPYYVGPLTNNGNSEFAWMERTGKAVRPWNFDETVGHETSAERFISRMVGNCTYLYQQRALPKQSLTYQLFEVLNEINVIKVDGVRISKPERDELFKLFLKQSKVKIADASKCLGDKKISGTAKETEFSSSLRSWHDMSQILGDINPNKVFSEAFDLQHGQRFEMAENLILWSTVFTDRMILKSKIEQTYPDFNNVKKVLALKYTGWGRLSNRLLVEMGGKGQHNVIQTLMYGGKLGKDKDEICYGFQEIITDQKLGFKEAIESYNRETRGEDHRIKLEWVEELAGSPAIKRGIWQSFQLVEELERIFGRPKRIVVEMAREDQLNPKRTKSRENQFKEIAEKFPEDVTLQRLKTENLDWGDVRTWLYCTQKARCAYSDETLDRGLLHLYQIDHIIPYSISLDDSLDNKVLVKSKLNQDKADRLMPLEIIPERRHSELKQKWREWYEKGLISSKKYHRLLIETITPHMAEGFINRQLVETRQITKHVVEMLNHRYAKEDNPPDILGLKAGVNVKVQKDLGIVKVREVNDKHHAIDAYMAATISEYVYTIGKGSWIDGKAYWKRNRTGDQLNDSYRKKNTWIVKEMKKNGLVSAQGEPLTEANSKSIYNWLLKQIDDPRFCVTRKLESNGEDRKFWKETLYSPKSKGSTLPEGVGKQFLGVYDSVKVAESLLCSLKVKKGESLVTEYRIESISYYEKEKLKDDLLERRFSKELGEKYLVGSIRIIKRLPLNTLLLIDGYPVHLLSKEAGRSAKQFEFSQNILKKINSLHKSIEIQELISLINELESKVKHHFIFASEGQLIKMEKSIGNLKEKLHVIELRNTQIVGTQNELDMSSEIGEEVRIVIRQLIEVLQPSSKRVESWSRLGRINVKSLQVSDLKLVNQSITGLEERIEVLKRNGEYVC